MTGNGKEDREGKMSGNKQPGKDDPCPCQSGLKFKQCCSNPQRKAMRQDQIRMRALAYVFLCQIHRVTGSPVVAVPVADLMSCVPEIKLIRDDKKGVVLCAAKPPQQKLIEAPRRIVLPN